MGGLGNRILACTYFGLTFVRVEKGPTLALHVSWHKPASPLIDALVALHGEPDRALWLREHVVLHVLDRGTQGVPTLRWCLEHGVPYLTLARGDAQWPRFRDPTDHTAQGVPIFVRGEPKLASVPRADETQIPHVVIFPAHPDRGDQDERALRYRVATILPLDQLRTLDQVYKARWPNNENPIKHLVAVGFDRNLDRTLDETTSRGYDGKLAKLRAKAATAVCEQTTAAQSFQQELTHAAQKRFEASAARRVKAEAKVSTHEAHVETKGARSPRGAELLWKLVTLILYNALALLLSRSQIEAVRVMTPERVRALLLGCSALACIHAQTLTLWITPTPSTRDRPLQDELLRLVNEARLSTPRGTLTIKARDHPVQEEDPHITP